MAIAMERTLSEKGPIGRKKILPSHLQLKFSNFVFSEKSIQEMNVVRYIYLL